MLCQPKRFYKASSIYFSFFYIYKLRLEYIHGSKYSQFSAAKMYVLLQASVFKETFITLWNEFAFRSCLQKHINGNRVIPFHAIVG